MKITMLKHIHANTCIDGVRMGPFRGGATLEVEDALAQKFIYSGWAVKWEPPRPVAEEGAAAVEPEPARRARKAA